VEVTIRFPGAGGHESGLIAAVAVGNAEIFDGHTRHQEILEHAILDDFDALRGRAFVVVIVGARELHTGELANGGSSATLKKFRQHFLVDLLGESLSLVFIALAMTFEAMAEHFVEEDRQRAPAEEGRAVVGLGDRRFAQIFQVRGHLVNLAMRSASLGRLAAAGAWKVSTRINSMPSSARVSASMIRRVLALGEAMAAPSLETRREVKSCTCRTTVAK